MDWQSILAIAIASAAALWVAWTVILPLINAARSDKPPVCGSCKCCHMQDASPCHDDRDTPK
jgi:hypothetical protein